MSLSGALRVGLLRVDGALIGLPIESLREVVPRPVEWDALPGVGPGLVGAMPLRGTVLPVLELGELSGRRRTTEAVGVVVLVHDGVAVGLLVDAVHDVVDLAPAALQPISARTSGSAPALFTATFLRPGTEEVGSLLDADALLDHPGVLTTTLDEAGRRASAIVDAVRTGAVTDPAGGLGRPLLLVRCAPARGEDVLLAVDVADVHTTLPTLTPQPSQLAGGVCTGVTDYGDVRIPVVDPLRLLGLPPADPQGPTQALLVKADRGLLAVMFTEVLEIVRVAAEDLVAVPGAGGPADAIVSRIARVPGIGGSEGSAPGSGNALVLDVAALLRDPDLAALAALNTSVADGSAVDGPPVGMIGVAGATAAGAGVGEPLVVLRARSTLAAPLAHVDRVIPFPADTVPWPRSDSGLGSMVLGAQAVPLLDLSAALGRGGLADPRSGVVLVVRGRHDEAAVAGFVVEGLDDIRRPHWQENVAEALAEGRDPLVQFGSADEPLLRRLDLPALVDALAPVPAGLATAERAGV